MTSRNFQQTILFQLTCWTIATNLYMAARIIGLEDYERIRVLEPIRYSVAFTQATAAGIIIGLMLGIIDVLLAHSSIKKRSFSFLIFTKGLVYITAIVLALAAILIFTDLFVDELSMEKTFLHLINFYSEGFFISMLLFAMVTSFLISFIKQVNNKFGPGIMVPMIFGKYYRPKQEDRVFMFLDLQSSTTHAEKIGHINFSELIQDCFYDLGTPVIKFGAEIYQYVGDEAVLSWKVTNKSNHLNMLRLFFAYDDLLKSKSEYYNSRYGIVPEFKAGMNCGMVMVSEVGEIKKEIAYHGDVLNTGARIQGECNRYGKKLLISETMNNIIPASEEFQIEKIGEVELKGKISSTVIYSVQRNELS